MKNKSHDHGEIIDPGEPVFDRDNRLIGHVSGFTEEGFTAELVEADEDMEEIPGEGAGEGYLMWRCEECGEMGELEDGMPTSCPNCGSPEEAITAMRED